MEIPTITEPVFPIDPDDPNLEFKLIAEDTLLITWKDTGKTATMSMDLWLRFVSYAVDVDTAISQYKAIQDTLVQATK